MRKLMILCLLLFGCQKPQYHLYVFYLETCPSCYDFLNQVVPALEEKYGNQMIIKEMNIDEKTSQDDYQAICLLLEDYPKDNKGSVPFIVLDGYFVKVGYQPLQKEEIIEVIDQAITKEDISFKLNDIYKFQEGKYFYKEEK